MELQHRLIELVREISLVSASGRPKNLIDYQREVLQEIDDYTVKVDLEDELLKEARKELVERMNKKIGN